MGFAEEKTKLAAELTNVHNYLRQALEEIRMVSEHAEVLTDQTETFADDTALARVSNAAKRTRQDLTALSRVVTEAREGLAGQ